MQHNHGFCVLERSYLGGGHRSAIFKVFIESVTILFLFYVLVLWPRNMWDLSSPTRNGTCTPSIGRQNLNHWTTKVVSLGLFEAAGVKHRTGYKITSHLRPS